MNELQTAITKFPATVNVAMAVIVGFYGNGEERKEKLEAEGYDYDTVQECVNEILKVFSEYE